MSTNHWISSTHKNKKLTNYLSITADDGKLIVIQSLRGGSYANEQPNLEAQS